MANYAEERRLLRGKKKRLWLGVLSLVALLVGARLLLLDGYDIHTNNMAPALETGGRALFASGGSGDRGDIVLIRTPEPSSLVITRVVGVGGERLEIADGEVLIDGAVLVEPYLPDGVVTEPRLLDAIVDIPAGHVFVMGDNRPGSSDSRVYGTVPASSIEGTLGRPFWWPLLP